jgi:hypothetical protein
MSKRKYTPKQVLRTLRRNALDAEAERLLSLTPEQMEEEARAEGIDPEQEAREADEWLAKFERGEIKPKTEAGRRMVEGEAPSPEHDDEALDRELAAKGIDPKAARERSTALADELLAKHTTTLQPVPPASASGRLPAKPSQRVSRARQVWAMALVTAVLVTTAVFTGPAVLVAMRGGSHEHSPPSPTRAPQPQMPENMYAVSPNAPNTDPAEHLSSAQGGAHDGAAEVRERAFSSCDQSHWADCLAGLDRAQAMDPAGDSAPRVRHYRQQARAALHLPAIFVE